MFRARPPPYMVFDGGIPKNSVKSDRMALLSLDIMTLEHCTPSKGRSGRPQTIWKCLTPANRASRASAHRFDTFHTGHIHPLFESDLRLLGVLVGAERVDGHLGHAGFESWGRVAVGETSVYCFSFDVQRAHVWERRRRRRRRAKVIIHVTGGAASRSNT